jgi:hypothetical protein
MVDYLFLNGKCLRENASKSYMPILMYGAKPWTWTKADISRLVAAEMRFLSTEGKTKGDRIRN